MPGACGLVGCCVVGGCAGRGIIRPPGLCWVRAVIVPEARMNALVVSTRTSFCMANLLVERPSVQPGTSENDPVITPRSCFCLMPSGELIDIPGLGGQRRWRNSKH